MFNFVVISTGPFKVHPKTALLCHSFRQYLTLSLTSRIPSVSDIPVAQEDCLRVLIRSRSCASCIFLSKSDILH